MYDLCWFYYVNADIYESAIILKKKMRKTGIYVLTNSWLRKFYSGFAINVSKRLHTYIYIVLMLIIYK